MSSEKNDNIEEKEGHCIADLVKCAVLVWSASLLTMSYLSIFPSMKMDNTFVASLLTGSMASFGIERKTNGNGNSKKKVDPTEPKPKV
tara:strand:- start:1537 stop:1800 length:264 start_codon:yes stop_codon:yes gene_type:complete